MNSRTVYNLLSKKICNWLSLEAGQYSAGLTTADEKRAGLSKAV